MIGNLSKLLMLMALKFLPSFYLGIQKENIQLYSKRLINYLMDGIVMVELILGNVLVESLVLIKLNVVKDSTAGHAILISAKIVLKFQF